MAVQEVGPQHPASPQTGEESDSRSFLVGSVFAGAILAAVLPAYAHVLYVIGRWSWQLIG